MYTRIGKLDHAAALALDAGNFATAEADARQALSLGQDSGLGSQILAAALNAQGKTQEALQAYQDMDSRGYTPPDVGMSYALLLLNTGQWAPAVAAYEKAQPYVPHGDEPVLTSPALSPDDPQPVVLATAIHLALGRVYDGGSTWGGRRTDDRALAEYGRALRLAPDSDVANYYYGRALDKLGRRVEARAVLEKAVRLAKGSVKAAAQKALAQVKKPA